jgi:choline dehydrogenase-like flavoprotein
MDVLDRANALAAAGRTVFHLEAGQPGTKARKLALDAAVRALGGFEVEPSAFVVMDAWR